MARDFSDYFRDTATETERLTPTVRELEALRHVSHGLTQAEIADVMCWSVKEIERMLAGARVTLAAKTTAHAVAIALRLGLID